MAARVGDCSQTPIGKKFSAAGNPFFRASPADIEVPVTSITATINFLIIGIRARMKFLL
jgi:hypothetical protein